MLCTMLGKLKALCAPLLLAMLVIVYSASQATAEEVWRVSKSSGEVAVTSPGGEQAPLIAGATLKPGDNVRTGQNGRVLLMRGEESILVSPNSSIGVPMPKKDGQRVGIDTTIIQQSGSILLEVEKKNVQHFQVETPYLAAVVKGTQFRVTVGNKESRVDVLRGQVEVADFKTGQFAMVAPGQAAQVSDAGKVGLALSGTGIFAPIQQGTPRASTVAALPVAAEAVAEAKPATRMASAFADTQWMHGTTQARMPDDNSWLSAFMPSKVFGGTSGHHTTTDDITLSIAFSILIGAAVTIGVAAQRRRKARKTIQS
jgi:hypothetical protein